MADPIKTPASPTPAATPSAATGQSIAKPVATPAAQGQAGSLPSGSNATTEAVKRGGNFTGKKRADGLTPGSPEAVAADKKKDAERKLAAYHARKAALAPTPPPLPAKPVQVLNSGASLAPPQSDLSGLADAEMVPWLGADLEGSVSETLKLLEEADLNYIEGCLERARITGTVAKEIMADAPWPESPKKGISKHGASAMAKVLNAVGISSKHKDIVCIAPSLAYLVVDRVKLHNALRKLIAATNPEPEKPAEANK